MSNTTSLHSPKRPPYHHSPPIPARGLHRDLFTAKKIENRRAHVRGDAAMFPESSLAIYGSRPVFKDP